MMAAIMAIENIASRDLVCKVDTMALLVYSIGGAVVAAAGCQFGDSVRHGR